MLGRRRGVMVAVLKQRNVAEINVVCPTITPTLGADMMDVGAGTFVSNTYGWTPYGTNLITNDANTLKIAHVDDGDGGYTTLSSPGDLTGNLVVGTWYQAAFDAKVSAGNPEAKLYNGASFVYGPYVPETDFAQKIMAVRALSTTGYLKMAVAVGQSSWVNNITFKPITFTSMLSLLGTHTRLNGTYICHPTISLGTSAGLIIGYADDNNFLLLRHDGSYAYLDQKSAGTWSNLRAGLSVYSAGAELKVVISSTNAELYYNGVQIGVDTTITTGVLGKAVYGFSAYSGNSVGLVTTNPLVAGTSDTFAQSTDYETIQDAINQADVIRIPAGVYTLTDALRVTRDGMIICGDGMGETILDFSASENVGGWNGATYGCISVDTLVSGEPLNNIVIRDLTIKTNRDTANAAMKPLYIGATDNCLIERVEIDGAKYEAIYHEDTKGKVSRNWTVRECVIHNHVWSAINSNDTQLIGAYIEHNHIYDGSVGIVMVGKDICIAKNAIERVVHGILLLCETGGSTFVDRATVVENTLVDIGMGDTTSSRFGITASLSNFDNDVTIYNNTIDNMHEIPGLPCYAIRSVGMATISSNLIRGLINPVGQAIAIGVAGDAPSGTIARSIINDNKVTALAQYNFGIILSNEELSDRARITNNHVETGSISENGFSLRDQRGASRCLGNTLGAQYIFGGVTYPAGTR